MGAIALLGFDDRTNGGLRHLPTLAGRPIESFGDSSTLLERLRERDKIDLVVVGTLLGDPIRTVQRVSAADADVAIIVLVKNDQEARLRRVLRFTPFISADLNIYATDTLDTFEQSMTEAVERTTRRRNHHATILALDSRLATAGPRERQAIRYLERLLDYVPVGIVTLDRKGIVESWNPCAAKIFETSERDALGRSVYDFFPKSAWESLADLFSAIPPASATGQPVIVQRETINGDVQFLEVTTTSLDGAADVDGILALFRDNTARVQAEQERASLLAQERAARAEAEAAVKAREEFLSIAAHELKTPLTSMRAAVQLLLRTIAKHREIELESLGAKLSLIEQQTRKLGNLVNQLLDISRIEAGRLRLERSETDVGRLVEEVASLARERTDQHAITVRVQAITIADVDPLRLEQVVANLVDNAIKYSPAGGPIDLVVCRPEPSQIEIAVTDRGIGVPVEHRPHLFERFFQVKTSSHLEGLGLGLYISRQIVELHGGVLRAEFPEDGGTRFIVRLPA